MAGKKKKENGREAGLYTFTYAPLTNGVRL